VKLDALLLCRDPVAVQTLCHALGSIGVSVEIFAGPEQALAQAKRKKFDTVIVDCDDVDGGLGLLKALHDGASSRRSIAIAILNRVTSMHDAFALGAHFVLEKPIAPDRALRSFRAAKGLMLAERRRYFRQPMQTTVFLSFGAVKDLRAASSNVSEGGMCLKLAEPLRPNTVVEVRFELPGKGEIKAEAEVAWGDSDGRCGLRFRAIPLAARHRLGDWLIAEAEKAGVNPALALCA
jgi:ActR/RegA family two-component response regulator